MPEHPEIRRYVKFINARCAGRKFKNVVTSEGGRSQILDFLEAEEFTIFAESRGKEIRLTLGTAINSVFVLFRHGLAGKWVYTDTPLISGKFCMFQYSDQEGFVAFLDTQRLGKWMIGSFDTKRGPDPIDDLAQLRQNVLNSTHLSPFSKSVASVMLNQKYFNGIGNYLRAEILYRARVPPLTPARDVFQDTGNGHCSYQGELIFQLCKAVSMEVLADPKLNKYGSPEDKLYFENWLQCYGKSETIKVDGRKAWYDPNIFGTPPAAKDMILVTDVPFAMTFGNGTAKKLPAKKIRASKKSAPKKKVKKNTAKVSRRILSDPLTQLAHVSSVQQPIQQLSSDPPQQISSKAKVLLMISVLWKAQKLTDGEKRCLKILALEGHPTLTSVLECFEAERDFDEAAETCKLLASLPL